MKVLLIAIVSFLATPTFAEKLKGVLVNPYSGYVAAIIIMDGGKIEPRHLSACGPGCEFTDFLMPEQCMAVSISRREGAFGYNFGPADDIANSRAQARRYCQRYGGSACKEYRPICY